MTTERSARPTAAARRRAREQEILAATRELLDAGGVRDAQIEEVAQAVGINRAIIYRHFTGKEELLALTLVGYLDELAEELQRAGADQGSAMDRLTAMTEAFVDFGIRYPAFVDCAQALMRRTGPELLEEIAESAMLRLGRAMTACLNQIGRVLEDGMSDGEFRTGDSVLLANHMYASGLGALQLARLGMLVKESESGMPMMTPVSPDQVKKYLVTTARALAAE
ncbi:MAG TPA: TetR/AcrR family transcriptional regulator [Marmoricola sp.]